MERRKLTKADIDNAFLTNQYGEINYVIHAFDQPSVEDY